MPVTLAGCKPEDRNEAGVCEDQFKMRNPVMWIGIFCGGVMTALLMMYRVKGAIIFGILLVSIISWPRGTPVTYFPYTAVGDDGFNFFKKVVGFHQIEKVLAVQEWNIGEYGGQFGLALITFLYVDILDCTGTSTRWPGMPPSSTRRPRISRIQRRVESPSSESVENTN